MPRMPSQTQAPQRHLCGAPTRSRRRIESPSLRWCESCCLLCASARARRSCVLLLCSDGRTGLCTQEDALASCRDSGAHPLGSSEDDGRDDGGDDGGVGSPQSSAGLDLTIGMQALIHPDSFSDDVGGVISDDESRSGVPAHWGEVLASPEKATGACYLPRTPGSLLDAAADACADW